MLKRGVLSESWRLSLANLAYQIVLVLEKVYPGSLPCFELVQGEAYSVAIITDYQMNRVDKRLPLFKLRLNGHLIEQRFR